MRADGKHFENPLTATRYLEERLKQVEEERNWWRSEAFRLVREDLKRANSIADQANDTAWDAIDLTRKTLLELKNVRSMSVFRFALNKVMRLF